MLDHPLRYILMGGNPWGSLVIAENGMGKCFPRLWHQKSALESFSHAWSFSQICFDGRGTPEGAQWWQKITFPTLVAPETTVGICFPRLIILPDVFWWEGCAWGSLMMSLFPWLSYPRPGGAWEGISHACSSSQNFLMGHGPTSDPPIWSNH